MKARKVKGVDPDGTLGDALERVVLVRLDELCAFMPRAGDPEEVEHLHDMRIAAKRLRYVLEVAGPCFGSYAVAAAKRTKALQDILGEIHDADVTLPRITAVAAEAVAEDARAARRAGGEADDLDPALAAGGPNAQVHRGLAALAAYHHARRELLFDRFLELWAELGRDGFRARLEWAAAERPTSSPDGDETGSSEVLASESSP